MTRCVHSVAIPAIWLMVLERDRRAPAASSSGDVLSAITTRGGDVVVSARGGVAVRRISSSGSSGLRKHRPRGPPGSPVRPPGTLSDCLSHRTSVVPDPPIPANGYLGVYGSWADGRTRAPSLHPGLPRSGRPHGVPVSTHRGPGQDRRQRRGVASWRSVQTIGSASTPCESCKSLTRTGLLRLLG